MIRELKDKVFRWFPQQQPFEATTLSRNGGWGPLRRLPGRL
jgi:hypothetical protein